VKNARGGRHVPKKTRAPRAAAEEKSQARTGACKQKMGQACPGVRDRAGTVKGADMGAANEKPGPA